MMNQANVVGMASTESRPLIIERRLVDLEGRLAELRNLADHICVTLSGMSVLPDAVPVDRNPKAPNMGLYSNIFTSLDVCEMRCAEIEQSLREAIR